MRRRLLVVLLVPLIAGAQPCAETTRMIKALALDAVDAAFRDYVAGLFDSWMRDETPDQRRRVERGMNRAIRAYLYSQQAVENWRGACK